MGLSHSERRAHERIRVEVEVSLESSSQLYTGITGDISHGGVFVPTWQELPVGTETDVELRLPNGVVEARAIVRWRREASEHAPPGVGIAFLEIGAPAQVLLSEFCSAREPLYYDVTDNECSSRAVRCVSGASEALTDAPTVSSPPATSES